jgi:hypothetical protein
MSWTQLFAQGSCQDVVAAAAATSRVPMSRRRIRAFLDRHQ